MFRWEDESVYDAGSNSRVPHMLLSSRRHFRKAVPEGSRLSRACARLSRQWGSLGDVLTHLIEIINEPQRVIVLKVLHALLILLSIKYVAELIAKVR